MINCVFVYLLKFLKFIKIKSFCLFYNFMIQPQTYLNVADNTGAQKVMCIHILGSNSQYANIGDVIIAVVKLSIFLFIKILFYLKGKLLIYYFNYFLWIHCC